MGVIGVILGLANGCNWVVYYRACMPGGTSISPRKQLQSLPEINDFGKLNRAVLGRPGPIQTLAGPRSLPLRG